MENLPNLFVVSVSVDIFKVSNRDDQVGESVAGHVHKLDVADLVDPVDGQVEVVKDVEFGDVAGKGAATATSG